MVISTSTNCRLVAATNHATRNSVDLPDRLYQSNPVVRSAKRYGTSQLNNTDIGVSAVGEICRCFRRPTERQQAPPMPTMETMALMDSVAHLACSKSGVNGGSVRGLSAKCVSYAAAAHNLRRLSAACERINAVCVGRRPDDER